MKYIDDKICKEYISWLRSPLNPNYKGQQYDKYDYYLNRLIEIAVEELKLINKTEVSITDIIWLEKFLKLYKSSNQLQEADKKNGTSAGRASLNNFINFVKYKNNSNKTSSKDREVRFAKYLEKCAEQSGKQKSTFLGYKSALIRWWERDAKQFSSNNSIFDFDDCVEFKSFIDSHWKGGDSDSKQGINLYIEFLSGEQDQKKGVDKKMPNTKEKELNLILYGPPGTGKTYNTVIKAVEIIDGNDQNADANVKAALQTLETDSGNKEAYITVLSRYRELTEQGRISFTTFHQSYGYEEFIEGIKPDLDSDEIKYKRADGVFKEFCTDAREIKQTKSDAQDLIKANATVWKISLDSAGRKGFEFHDKCLDDSYIRVGWDEADDISLVTADGKDSARRFVDDMEIGDIVLSCYSQSEIDAIGIIIGEYEWHENEPRLKRFRKVRWLRTWRGKEKYNIKPINHGKNLTQTTVYRLQISIDDIIKIVNEKPQGERNKIEYKYDNPYVFIIDEINRGNVSKIFGELITLIEPTKRLGAEEEMKCTLPYSGDKFGVPKNVYILGTMNTADRSLVQLDAALRRRFAFEEMMPKPELLKDKGFDKIELDKLLEKINERITALLDREHQIGHSYFMNLHNVKELAYVFKQKIIPLLQEYFFDDYESIQKVLGVRFMKEEPNPFNNGSKIFSINLPEVPEDYIKIYSDTDLTDNG